MSMKQSLIDNKDQILESLPSQELKDAFLKELDTMEDPAPVAEADLVAQAQEPEHVTEDMYNDAKSHVVEMPDVNMTQEEIDAAIKAGLDNPPTAPPEAENHGADMNAPDVDDPAE